MKDRWSWRSSRALVIVLAISAVALLWLGARYGLQDGRSTKRAGPTTVNVLAARLKAGEVKSIDVIGERVIATTTSGETVSLLKEGNSTVPQLLASFGVTSEELIQVTYTVSDPQPQINWPGLAGLVLMVAVVTVIVLRRTQIGGQHHQAISFLKSGARVFVDDKPAVTFADIAGVDEAKQELEEVVSFLRYPERFLALGARVPRGVLLVGPPGTGKTLLSRGVAGEASVPFFSISGSHFVEMFVGVGASRVRDLFDQARRNAPCIVFVDEIDAVGRQRGGGATGSHEEREQTLNQILVEMDGFDTRTNVIIMAATNRPDILDPALLRPGRFDRHVVLPKPDLNGRRAILEVHAKGKPFEPMVDMDILAKQTPGFSGADLANLLNEAAILAARRQKKLVGMVELEDAIDRVICGAERKSHVMSDREKQLTAYHEAGHAVVARFLDNHDPVDKVSIIARGFMGGYTRFLPSEEHYYITRSQFESMIASALGGHAAEVVVFGEVSTGAGNDIEKATHIARGMVREYGMAERLGPISLGPRSESALVSEPKNYSESLAEAIDEEIYRLIDEAYAKAMVIIKEHRAVLDHLAQELIRVETVGREDLERIFREESPLGGSTMA
ncbi:MAG: ATP-dependent zinc metalloprotease FtsH [Chloroflexota bacterium]|nr:ATP-dependent zinc metalloprotease FtsH [Chloroflexota bacterium]